MKDQLIQTRLQKVERMRELGVNPYPHRFEPTHTSAVALEHFDALSAAEEPVTVAGRLMALRMQGKAGFGNLQDDAGSIQIYFKKDCLDELSFRLVKLLDLSDIIGVRGRLFVTRTGQKTVEAHEVTVLSKAIRPMPVVKRRETEDGVEAFDEVKNKEARYRQRHLDLSINPDVREVFRKRARIITGIRQFLDARGYVEVETPILQPLYGGAAARPFTTHHNALDRDLYLRIADELYLKRLIVGGFDRVYEIAKNFRNEGMDRSHNPEFTSMECYAAYLDYHDMMELVESLVASLAREIHGTCVIGCDGAMLDLTPPFERLSMNDALQRWAGVGIDASDAELLAACKRHDVATDGNEVRTRLLDLLLSELVEPNLEGPVFLVDYPVEISPLAKRDRNGSKQVERFELFIRGMEYANAFSELNDPVDQRERFMAQADAREAGDDEAHPVDEDFLRAVEHGMPPTGGLGLGVDRLVMLLTDQQSIRDVLLFPAMRTEPAPGSDELEAS